MATIINSLSRCLILIGYCTVITLLIGCDDNVRVRPYGYLKIGPAKNYQATEMYLPKMRLIIRRDAGGLYALSTLCTHDLAPLYEKKLDTGEIILVSAFSASQYRLDGTVIHGPAVANLPYYKLKIEEGLYGGPKDTLYVEIGNEVPPQWRLPVN